MFCPNCGKELKEGMAFCQYCGNPLNAQTKSPETEPVKGMGGSFFRSLQEKAKSVGESMNAAAEEAQKKAEEQKKAGEATKVNTENQTKKPPKTVQHTGKQEGRFKEDKFVNALFTSSGSVIVDRLTGVNYLFMQGPDSDCGGLTVLVDENGKPLVTKEDIIKTDSIGEE